MHALHSKSLRVFFSMLFCMDQGPAPIEQLLHSKSVVFKLLFAVIHGELACHTVLAVTL